MRVVFLQSVNNIARAGDLKEVADGYARNYLIPHKLAVAATASAEAMAVMQKKIQVRQLAKEEALLREMGNEIQGKEVIIRAKVGTKDKLFGSVTAADIAEALQKATHIEIDKRKIELAEPIKLAGTYEIEVKLSKDVNPKIKVTVEPEEEVKSGNPDVKLEISPEPETEETEESAG